MINITGKSYNKEVILKPTETKTLQFGSLIDDNINNPVKAFLRMRTSS